MYAAVASFLCHRDPSRNANLPILYAKFKKTCSRQELYLPVRHTFRTFLLYFKNASAFLLRDARHAMHDILLLRISAILPEAISDGGLTPTTDTDLLLATYRGGSHFTSDIFFNVPITNRSFVKNCDQLTNRVSHRRKFLLIFRHDIAFHHVFLMMQVKGMRKQLPAFTLIYFLQ